MSGNIEYHKFPHGETCTLEGCRSRRYYVLDGQRFCKTHGHQQEGYKQIQADEDDFNSQGRKTRKKKEEKEKVRTVLSGVKATELFLECVQLVLWKQVNWLVKEKGLPKELEIVVRDLWAIRLLGVKGLGGEQEEGKGKGRVVGEDGSVGYSSAAYTDTSADETDSDAMGSVSDAGRMKRSRKKKSNGLPKLVETLGLCYLGILLMRLPVSMGEVASWVEKEEIVYLRALREVPKEMRTRLPAFYVAALESRSVPPGDRLHNVVLELIISFKQRFDFGFPALNAPLLMFKHVRELCLPLDIYSAANRLGKVLDLDYAFPDSFARHHVTSYPEIQIISLIVIATKLSQPFDDVKRNPWSLTDPSTTLIGWNDWSASFQNDPIKGLNRGEEVNITDHDVLHMSENMLDDYLNWYQKVFIDDRDPALPQQILDLFPIVELAENIFNIPKEVTANTEKLKRVNERLIWQKPLAMREDQDESVGIKRPGELYMYYRKVEEISEKAKPFYEQAARNAGVSLETLTRAVYLLEINLQGWIAEKKRKEAKETAVDFSFMDEQD